MHSRVLPPVSGSRRSRRDHSSRLHRWGRKYRDGVTPAIGDQRMLRRAFPIGTGEIRRVARTEAEGAQANVWLINTGWRQPGIGARIAEFTRAIIDAITPARSRPPPTQPDRSSASTSSPRCRRPRRHPRSGTPGDKQAFAATAKAPVYSSKLQDVRVGRYARSQSRAEVSRRASGIKRT